MIVRIIHREASVCQGICFVRWKWAKGISLPVLKSHTCCNMSSEETNHSFAKLPLLFGCSCEKKCNVKSSAKSCLSTFTWTSCWGLQFSLKTAFFQPKPLFKPQMCYKIKTHNLLVSFTINYDTLFHRYPVADLRSLCFLSFNTLRSYYRLFDNWGQSSGFKK